MDISVRKMDTSSYSKIPKLYSESFNDKPWEKNWYEIEQFSPDSNWIAVDGVRLVGFIITFLSKGTPYISVVAVLPEYQGNGVGQCLIKTAEKYWNQRGLSKIRIHVSHQRHQAKKVYEFLNYQVIADDGEDFEMMKSL